MDYQVITLTPAETEGIYINDVDSLIPTNSPTASGILFAIQLVTKNLLTEYGTNIFNPEEGCSLVTLVGQAISQDILKNLTAEITNLLDRNLEEIKSYQDTYQIPEEELITDLSIREFYFDPTTLTLYLSIDFITNSGSLIVGITQPTA